MSDNTINQSSDSLLNMNGILQNPRFMIFKYQFSKENIKRLMNCKESSISSELEEILEVDSEEAQNRVETLVELEQLERNVKQARSFAYWFGTTRDDVKFGTQLSMCVEIFRYVSNHDLDEAQIAEYVKELILRHAVERPPRYVRVFSLEECKMFILRFIEKELDFCYAQRQLIGQRDAFEFDSAVQFDQSRKLEEREVNIADIDEEAETEPVDLELKEAVDKIVDPQVSKVKGIYDAKVQKFEESTKNTKKK